MNGPTPAPAPRKRLLGQRLLDGGIITQNQLSLALREQKRLGLLLGEVLVHLGFISQDTLARIFAEETLTESFVDVANTVIEREVLNLVPYELARRHQFIPLNHEGSVLTIAMADTFNVVAVDEVERHTGLTVQVAAASAQDILFAIDQRYSQDESIESLIDAVVLHQGSANAADPGAETPMIRLVDQILAMSIRRRATDIHFEPDENVMRVRLRIDGILHQAVFMPKSLQLGLCARVKIMANLDVTEQRLPQDGRIKFMMGKRQVDLRVSSIPTQYGESLVLRVLDKSSVVLKAQALGFSSADGARFQEALMKPHGLLLVTGPTGSGKTTTLYTAVGQIDALTRSVFTLEDPIEYRLPFIRQTQVNAEIGLTFAGGLRALLRQDPDVILVGEIRDEETAQLAIRASLTGHLVLSTLHTNTAAGAIPRLINMGIEPYLLASSLIAVIGQRLVRRICPQCRFKVPDPRKFLDDRGYAWKHPEEPSLWRGKGCISCLGTGHRGRIGVYEVLTLTNAMRDMCESGANERDIEEKAIEAGMTTMRMDGMAKVNQGFIDIDEMIRILGS